MKDDETNLFEHELKKLIVGQERAVKHATDLIQNIRAGLTFPGHPIGNVLLLGPTGSGKTRLVEAMAKVLFDDERSLIKIDCGEFQHSHEIAKIIGSPPGYLGHRETQPALTQEAINSFHTDHMKLTLILFDEIEKASDALWKLMLGILDKATLTLGDNRRVDFSRCIIFMTSNLGGGEISRMMSGGGIGFGSVKVDAYSRDTEQAIYRTALQSAKSKFSPEFMNRIDKTIVFRPLKPEHMEKILDVELDLLQQNIIAAQTECKFVFRCSEAAREFIIKEGIDPKYGARPLKRAIKRFLANQFTRLMATGQIYPGDLVEVDIEADGKSLAFFRTGQDIVIKGLAATTAMLNPDDN